jgi:hypothetical protein
MLSTAGGGWGGTKDAHTGGACCNLFSPSWCLQPGLNVPFEPGLKPCGVLAIGTMTNAHIPVPNVAGTNASGSSERKNRFLQVKTDFPG